MSGSQTTKPGLTFTATAGVVQGLKAKLTCTTGTTGQQRSTVKSGRIVATKSGATLSCSTAALPSLTATIKWTATGGKVNPTYVIWAGGTNSTSAHHQDLPGVRPRWSGFVRPGSGPRRS